MLLLPLDESAVRRVAHRMRAADRREIYASRWREDDDVLTREVVQLSRFGAVAALDGGTPVAAMGVCPLWPGVWTAWMFATDDWPKIARAMTRWARRTLMPAVAATGAHRVECRSIEGHDLAHRWLDHLGAVREAEMPDCGKRRETFYLYAWRLRDRARNRIDTWR